MWKKLPYKSSVYFSVALNVASIILVLIIRNSLPPVVPLFYGLPVGTEQLIPSLGLLLAPAAGLTITAINIVMSSVTNDVFLRKALIISSAFVSILLTITVIKIVLLVGFF